MTGLHERKNCPYCGHSVSLGDCVIVGTNSHTIARKQGEEGRESLPSGAKVLRWVETGLDRLPVLAEPPVSKAKNPLTKVTGRLRQLPPLTGLAPAEDLPARLCPQCTHPMPPGLDDRPVFTIAVVGTIMAGKTHYLAGMVRDASRLQGLEMFGCTEFAPDEQTAGRYEDRYFDPLFQESVPLANTSMDDSVRFRPLVFEVTFEGQQPCLLMFHDVAGEGLQDRSFRAGAASFVRRAAGVIFLIDPLAYPGLRGGADRPIRLRNQADLLRACISDLDASQRATVPYAITLSKSDIVAAAAADRAFLFAREPATDAHEWDVEMKLVEKEVRQLLAESGARDLLAAANQLAQLSFHAVSPIGRAPNPDGSLAASVKPLRCLEPLATVLHRIPGITGT